MKKPLNKTFVFLLLLLIPFFLIVSCSKGDDDTKNPPIDDSETFTITKGTSANGSFTVEPSSLKAKKGDTITIKPSADAGYEFDSWDLTPPQTVTNQGNNTYTFIMPEGNVTVNAVFKDESTITKYSITKGTHEGGDFTIDPAGLKAKEGDIVTLTPTEDTDYNFVSFDLNPVQEVTDKKDGTYTFVMPNVDVTINAIFNKVVSGSGTGTKTLTVVGGVGKVPKFVTTEGDDIWDKTRHITVTVELENGTIKTVVLNHELTRYWVETNNKGAAGWAYGTSWYNGRIGLANFITNAEALASSIASSNNADIAYDYTGGASGAAGDYTGAWDFHAAAIRQAVKDAVDAIKQGKPNRVLAGGGLSGTNKEPWTADGVPLSGDVTLTGSGYMSGNNNPTSSQTPTDVTAKVVLTNGEITEVTVLAAGELNCGWNGSTAQNGFKTNWPNQIIQKNAWEDAAGPVDAVTAATVSRDSLVNIVKKAVQKMAYEY